MREPFFDPKNPNEQKLTFLHLKNAHRVQAHANTVGRSSSLSASPHFSSYKLIIAPEVKK